MATAAVAGAAQAMAAADKARHNKLAALMVTWQGVLVLCGHIC